MRHSYQALGWWFAPLALAGSLMAASGDLRLVDAIERGDRDTVRSLLEQNTDANVAEADGTTPLAWAAHRNDLESAGLLIQAGADPSAANDYGVTPLTLACANRNAPMVEKLLDAGADPNVAQWTGETPLMTCANAGNAASVSALVDAGADLEAKESQKGQTALMWAAAEGHSAVVKVLTGAGAAVSARSKIIPVTQEHYSIVCTKEDPCMNGKMTGINYPDAIHFRKSTGGFTPLLFAARIGDVESARILLAAGAGVDESTEEDGTALVVAAASGREEMARMLLAAGADPNATDAFGIAPLHYALHEGLMRITSARPKSTDVLGWQRPNMLELMKELLAAGADPNAGIQMDFPPYDYAPIARSNGNNLPQISMVGVTPFILAAASSDVQVMRYLVERRADPKLVSAEKTSALMVAAGIGHERAGFGRVAASYAELQKSSQVWDPALEAVKMVLDLGGDVNAVNADGRTALHGAVFLGAMPVIRQLVEKGADLEAKDRYGQTPLSMALGDPEGLVYRQFPGGRYDNRFRQMRPQKQVAELLLELGAKPFAGEYRDRSGE